MLYEYSIKTASEEMVNITRQVEEAVREAGIEDGLCVVYCTHTTAAITINENADPDVKTDILYGLNKIVEDYPEFKHFEGNSQAHIKSSLVGASESLMIENGKLLRGTWQGIYFMEFDGPRNRKFFVKVI